MRSNGPEGGGQDARHKLPGIKQVKSPSLRMGFLRFCGPGSVPACLPGGAALTGATDSHPPCTTCSPDKVRSTASGETSGPTAGFVNISNTYHINRLSWNCPY
ncbi:hypothetical protein DMS64_07800 [Klebsiella variicola]|nr:hypothetical protein [Klebsiella variicola]OWW14252.1 hypothetical protein BUE65_18080 [Klebsiella variicola]PXK92942.1 hypothetical protein DMS44_18565 [Klebsiella variicola]PXL55125.1 hypothetical protein DMS45_18590 [Klebsiella variicola]PXM27665.1 hypothetical protein DMS64_07800 [Klebsiella variicola]